MKSAKKLARLGRLQPKSKTTRMWQPPVHLQDQPKSRVSRDDWERGKAKAERRAAWMDAERDRRRLEGKTEESSANAYLGDAPVLKARVATTKVTQKFYSVRKAAQQEE